MRFAGSELTIRRAVAEIKGVADGTAPGAPARIRARDVGAIRLR